MKHYFYTEDGKKFEVGIGFTSRPANTTYEEPAWWAYTIGRNPDIEVAGPCVTRRELEQELELQKLRGVLKTRNRQLRSLRRTLRK